MGACCTKTVDTTTKALKRVVNFLETINDRLGFFLYYKKDGNIIRYYLKNLGKVITDILPFREDDELMYLDGNVMVNKSPEEVTRTVNSISPGKPITIIGSRPTGQGNFIYNYVEGSFQEPLYPDLNGQQRAAALMFRPTVSYTTSEPVYSLPTIRTGYVESWVHRGQYLKYDPLSGMAIITGGLNYQDPGFLFWRCPVVMFELLRSGANPIREAFRPESLPLFLSTSSSTLSWEFRPAGQYGHPAQADPDLLFSPVLLSSDMFAMESHRLRNKFVKLSNGALQLDEESPHTSAESRFFFWDLNASP